MSPELMNQKSKPILYSKKDDIYSLGIILYQILH